MELVFTICVAAFLVAMALLTRGFGADTITGDVFGPSGFPLLLIAIGLLLTGLIALGQLRGTSERTQEKLLDLSTRAGRALVSSAAVLVAYLAIMNVLGYVLSTLVFSFVAAWVMGYRKIPALAAFSVVVTAALFLLFGRAFYIPLPRGVSFLRDLSYVLY
jgi:putative tricarboxylic transport membrane protein